MKVQKKTLITLVAGALLLGSAAVMAFGGGHGFAKGGCDHGSPMEALHRLDNVTDEQRTQLRKLFDEQRDAMREQRRVMFEGRKAVREAILGGASRDEVQKLAAVQGERVTATIMAKADLRQKVAGILSKAQMEQLLDWRLDGMEHHHRW